MFANRHRSSVPSANDVLIPETLLKKRKADAKLREENQAKALELRRTLVKGLVIRNNPQIVRPSRLLPCLEQGSPRRVTIRFTRHNSRTRCFKALQGL